MGECIMTNSRMLYASNSNTNNLPILNENYPMDKSVKYGNTISLLTIIDKYPADCNYQWYLDNNIIDNANEAVYDFTPPTDSSSSYNIFCVVSNKLGTVYSRTALIKSYPTTLYLVKNSELYITLSGSYDLNKPLGYISVDNGKTMTTETLPTSAYNTLTLYHTLFGGDSSCTATITIGDKKYTINVTTSSYKKCTIDISDIKQDYPIKISASGDPFVIALGSYNITMT